MLTSIVVGGLAVVVAVQSAASAAPGLAGDEGWRVRSTGGLTVDGGLILAAPAALPTGLSTGIGAGVMFGRNSLAWAARASWSTATESSIGWTVSHDDLSLRAGGAVQHDVGRGRLALRLGLGATVVHETRTRNQGARAGLTGSALETSVFSTLPAADLQAVVAVHVLGPWLLILNGGPSVAIESSTWHLGWTSQLGVGWQP
ncbi:MAG: hypothetical protein ABJA82_06210 [Myxococcales bacterium]